MFSHVWGGAEPTFQDVNRVESIWTLPPIPLNIKVQDFCRIVRQSGGRWCWSDTCCIDKTNSSVRIQSITSMYRWYQLAAATLVYLADVISSGPGNFSDSHWMLRAWTGQELLSSKVIRFYTRDWKPYRNDTSANHKESPLILAELSTAIGIASGTIATFSPRDLGVMEKLRFASMRKATVDEDLAYSLIGIFESDIVPRYGEGKEIALGHLLEEIVSRTGEVAVLAWTGMSSGYSSALPSDLSVYNKSPRIPPAIDDTAMELRTAEVRSTLPPGETMTVYDRISRLPSVRFTNRRLYLPCIAFPVQGLERVDEKVYRASISVLGDVSITTADMLPLQRSRNLCLVHPWMRNLLDQTHSLDGSTFGEYEFDGNMESLQQSSPMNPTPANSLSAYTLALQLLVRLEEPFSALLLERKSHREFSRVAADQEITVQIPRITSSRDIQTTVIEIL